MMKYARAPRTGIARTIAVQIALTVGVRTRFFKENMAMMLKIGHTRKHASTPKLISCEMV